MEKLEHTGADVLSLKCMRLLPFILLVTSFCWPGVYSAVPVQLAARHKMFSLTSRALLRTGYYTSCCTHIQRTWRWKWTDFPVCRCRDWWWWLRLQCVASFLHSFHRVHQSTFITVIVIVLKFTITANVLIHHHLWCRHPAHPVPYQGLVR